MSSNVLVSDSRETSDFEQQSGAEKISASERRRLRKTEQTAAKKADKAMSRQTTSSQKNDPECVASSVEELDPTQYFESRITMLNEAKQNGVDVYPHKFHVSISVPTFIERFECLKDGEHREDVEVMLAGRLMRIAGSGQALRFYDIVGEGAKIQVMAKKDYHDESIGDFLTIHNRLRRGDIVGIRGFPGKSQRGELSIFPYEIKLLSTCFHMLPKDRTGLKDQEIRYRQRYLDMLINSDIKRTFQIRSMVIRHIRHYLEKQNFVEVETPMMNQVAGGAAARPFITRHNELDMNLFMRIAPELFLKQLVVGGMDRVFEIGKNFRNEGIDLTHNPEFTACEFYMAYADYNDLCQMTEELVSSMALQIHGTYKVQYQPDGPDGKTVEIDFTPPYPRVSFVEEIEKRSGVKLPRPLDSDDCIEFMKALLKKNNIDWPFPQTSSKLLDKLCGFFIEDNIVSPTFIADHPQIMSPLAKWHRSRPEMTERCELFILGKEVANFYTELNDPIRQRQCFIDQSKAKAQGDDEANDIDEDFCKSLEYGLPPTGGWGIGIDRMVMFMANKNNIKEVILFPAMRPLFNPTTKKL